MSIELSEYEDFKRKTRLKTATGVANQKAYSIFRVIILAFSRLFFKPEIYSSELIPQPNGLNYIPAKVSERDPVPSTVVAGSFIIASNHGGVLDIPFIGQFKRTLVWICKPHFCLHPIMGLINQRMGAVPVFRPSIDGNTDKNSHKRIKELKMVSYEPTELIEVATRAVKSGVPAIIFPEGSRLGDELVADAKYGMARIAIKSNRPILPIAIVGSSRKDPVVRVGLLRRRVVIGLVGELIHPEDYRCFENSLDAEKAITRDWIDSINSLRKQGIEILSVQ